MEERRFILKTFNDFYRDEYENVLDVFRDFTSKFTYTTELNVMFGFKMLRSFLVRNYAKIKNPEMADGLIFDYLIEMQNQDDVERRLEANEFTKYSNKFYCAWYVANEFITYLSTVEAERESVNDIYDTLIDLGYDEEFLRRNIHENGS